MKAMKTKYGLLIIPGLLVLAVFGYFALRTADRKLPLAKYSPSRPATGMERRSERQPAAESPEQRGSSSGWTYGVDEDAQGRKRFFATVSSSNPLNFRPPYQGSQHGTLRIRRTAGSGTQVIISVERGQFFCTFNGCAVTVQFDSGPIESYSAAESDELSLTTFFLSKESKFISQLRKAKIVRIEANFFQEGSRSLEFDVDGLNWP